MFPGTAPNTRGLNSFIALSLDATKIGYNIVTIHAVRIQILAPLPDITPQIIQTVGVSGNYS